MKPAAPVTATLELPKLPAEPHISIPVRAVGYLDIHPKFPVFIRKI